MHMKISSAKWQLFCPGGDEFIGPTYFIIKMFDFTHIVDDIWQGGGHHVTLFDPQWITMDPSQRLG